MHWPKTYVRCEICGRRARVGERFCRYCYEPTALVVRLWSVVGYLMFATVLTSCVGVFVLILIGI